MPLVTLTLMALEIDYRKLTNRVKTPFTFQVEMRQLPSERVRNSAQNLPEDFVDGDMMSPSCIFTTCPANTQRSPTAHLVRHVRHGRLRGRSHASRAAGWCARQPRLDTGGEGQA